jgi:hypothetical protein
MKMTTEDGIGMMTEVAPSRLIRKIPKYPY